MKTAGATNTSTDSSSVGCWRDKKVFVLQRNRDAPLRCIKCNAPAQLLPKPYAISWHAPGYYVLLLFYVLAYFLVTYFVKKRATVNLAVCAKHRAQRQLLMTVGGCLCVIGVPLLFIGEQIKIPAVTYLGWALLLIGLVGTYRSKFVRAVEIDAETVKLRGCCEEFLNSLPVAH
jgi:hypothetical protein